MDNLPQTQNSFLEKIRDAIINLQTMEWPQATNLANRYFYSYFAAKTNIAISQDEGYYAAIGFKNRQLTVTFSEPECQNLSVYDLSIVFIHEILHLIQKHTARHHIRPTSREEMMKNNAAADIAINQLENLDAHVDRLGGFNLKRLRELVKNDSIEALQSSIYYRSFLDNEAADEYFKQASKVFDDHDQLDKMDELEKQTIYAEVKNAAYKARKVSSENLSGNLSELIDNLGNSIVNWRANLRNFGNRSIDFTKKATRSKLNRRFGMMARGKNKKWEPKFACILDTSGSMSLDNIKEGVTEFAAITRVYPEASLYLIECDAVVQEVVKFDSKSIKNLKIKGRGGTQFNPALEKAKELDVDAIVFFTDGGCFDVPEDPKIPLVWCITKDGVIPTEQFGKVITMKDE